MLSDAAWGKGRGARAKLCSGTPPHYRQQKIAESRQPHAQGFEVTSVLRMGGESMTVLPLLNIQWAHKRLAKPFAVPNLLRCTILQLIWVINRPRSIQAVSIFEAFLERAWAVTPNSASEDAHFK
jgi:hypothetical protein